MALTIDQIIAAKAPQYSSHPNKTALQELAELQTSVNFGTRYNLAVALRMMHTMALETLAGGDPSSDTGIGAPGSVIMEKEGALARQYASSLVVAQKYPDLTRTSFGQELIELIRMTIFAPRTRMSTTDG